MSSHHDTSSVPYFIWEGGRWKRAGVSQYLAGGLLHKNLRERLKEVMDRKQSCLPEVEERASDGIPAKARGIKDQSVHQIAEPPAEPQPEKHYRTIPPSPYQRPAGMSYDAFQKQVRRDKRAAR